MNAVLVPRPAATLMLIRDGAAGLEVLMLRRSPMSDFVPDAYVFPGGAVDDEDDEPRMRARCTGRDDPQANSLLALDHGGLAYWVSAFRECFEEAGVLVATGPGGEALSFEDPAVEARFVEHRRALNAGERSFLEICEAEDLLLPADALYYVGHWITPEGPPRRYDTRFFVTPAPIGQTAVHDAVETTHHMWVAPRDALALGEAGQIELLLPTIWNLGQLDRFDTTSDLVRSASSLGAVPTVAPRIEVDEQGNRRLVVEPEQLGDGVTGRG